MYKLYGTKKSRAFRVIWMLEELGQEYELVETPPRSDAIRTLNPSGKIPALMAGDDVLIDSVAIMQFLADKHGQLTFPAGTIERAKQDSFTQFACDELDGCLWTAARNTFVLPEERRIPEIKATLRWEFDRSIKTLAQRLGDKEWLMGDTFTVADIVTAHSGTWARNAGFEIAEASVNDLIDRAIARPAWKTAAQAGKRS